MKVEWGKNPDFAEVAEALNVPTDHVMSMLPLRGVVFVMFTREYDAPDTALYSAKLQRGVDGILFLASPERKIPGGLERMGERIDELMKQFQEDDADDA